MGDRTDLRAAIAGLLMLAGALGCDRSAATMGVDSGVGGLGGSGGSSPLDASPGQGVVLVPIESRETIADPGQPVVYLAATANSSIHPTSVVAVSTATGAVLWATPLPFEPGDIAVADDGSTLYVSGWVPDTHVARLNLSSHAIELMFSLPASPDTGRPFQAQDIAVIPGSPHAAVVSMIDIDSGLAVFDDANMRPNQQLSFGQERVVIHMGGPDTLYALVNGGGLRAFAVDAQGIGSMTGPALSNLTSYALSFSYDGELIFGNDGAVVDPRTGTRVGMYDGQPAAVAVDRPAGRSYLALQPPQSSDTGPLVIAECDRLAFTRLRTLTLEQVGQAWRMVLATDGTLALDALLDKNELLLIHPSAWSNASQP
jgi:hypothetical protein